MAKEFPSVFESELILSFVDYLPGAIGERWIGEKHWFSGVDRVKYTLLVPIFAFLEWMGTITMRVQKAIVHILQPLIVVAGIVLALLFAANPIWLIIPAAIIFFEAYQWTKRDNNARVDISEESAMNEKMSEPLKEKPVPDEFDLTDVDGQPQKVKPVEDNINYSVKSSSVNVVDELSSPTKNEEVAEQKVETIAKEIPIEADTKLDVPKPSLKKKKTFAAYEIEDNNSLSNENDMAIIGLSQKVNDDDDQTVFSDDGKPTGVVKKMKQNRKSDSSYRKNNRRDRKKAQELFEEFERDQKEKEESGCREDDTSNSFSSPPKTLDPFRVSPVHHSLHSSSSNVQDIVPSPFLDKVIVPLELRDIRRGRVHLPPVIRKGGPGSKAIQIPSESENEDKIEEDSSQLDEDIPKLKWEK